MAAVVEVLKERWKRLQAFPPCVLCYAAQLCAMFAGALVETTAVSMAFASIVPLCAVDCRLFPVSVMSGSVERRYCKGLRLAETFSASPASHIVSAFKKHTHERHCLASLSLQPGLIAVGGSSQNFALRVNISAIILLVQSDNLSDGACVLPLMQPHII